MIPYVISCLVSTGFIFLYYRIKVGDSKLGLQIVRFCLFILAVSFPCFLAAFRGNNVGTDVTVYGLAMFNSASGRNFVSFMLESYKDVEILYKALVYVLSIPNNRYFYFFGIELACILPVYYRLVKDYPDKAWMGVITYHIWLYGFSLNIMRQSIAISILLWGSKFLFERDFRKYCLVVILSMGFHLTGIFGVLIYGMYTFLTYEPNKKNKGSLNSFIYKYRKLLRLICLIALLLIVYNASSLINFISNLLNRYNVMAVGISSTTDVGAGYLLLVGTVILILWYLSKKRHIDQNPKIQFYSFIMIFGVICFYMSIVSGQMFRVSLYFTSYIVLYLSYSFEGCKKNSVYNVWAVILLAIGTIFIYHYYVKIGWNGIYPYIPYFK